MKGFCETEALCTYDENEILGILSDDIWLPFTFKWADVIAIKESAVDDSLGPNKATIYLPGVLVTINKLYSEAISEWMNA